MKAGWVGAVALVTMVNAVPAAAQSARELLTQASFHDDDKDVALRRITQAQAAATASLRQSPGDAEASLMQATALGYRAKLTGSRADAIGARKQFEALIARDPRNPESQVALGAWHLGAVYRLGGLVGRTALGARKNVGLEALDRAVALGGNRAMFPGLAALLRLEMDPTDPRGRALAEAASRGSTPTAIDRIMQRAAAAVAAAARSGNVKLTRALSARLLPFGRLDD